MVSVVFALLGKDGKACKIQRGPAFRNTIVVIGDDIAYGMGDSKNIFQVPGIASKLKSILERIPNIKQTWDIYNCGVPNSTSQDWLPTSEKKTDSTLFERVFQVQKYLDAKIVILMVGYNDGRIQPKITPSETLDKIASIVKVLLNMGKHVYVCPVLNHADHKYQDLYGDNLERNELIISYCSNSRPNLYLGPEIHNLNYEYKGDFLYTPDGQLLNPRGYLKFAKDFADLLTNHLVRIEFQQFRTRNSRGILIQKSGFLVPYEFFVGDCFEAEDHVDAVFVKRGLEDGDVPVPKRQRVEQSESSSSEEEHIPLDSQNIVAMGLDADEQGVVSVKELVRREKRRVNLESQVLKNGQIDGKSDTDTTTRVGKGTPQKVAKKGHSKTNESTVEQQASPKAQETTSLQSSSGEEIDESSEGDEEINKDTLSVPKGKFGDKHVVQDSRSEESSSESKVVNVNTTQKEESSSGEEESSDEDSAKDKVQANMDESSSTESVSEPEVEDVHTAKKNESSSEESDSSEDNEINTKSPNMQPRNRKSPGMAGFLTKSKEESSEGESQALLKLKDSQDEEAQFDSPVKTQKPVVPDTQDSLGRDLFDSQASVMLMNPYTLGKPDRSVLSGQTPSSPIRKIVPDSEAELTPKKASHPTQLIPSSQVSPIRDKTPKPTERVTRSQAKAQAPTTTTTTAKKVKKSISAVEPTITTTAAPKSRKFQKLSEISASQPVPTVSVVPIKHISSSEDSSGTSDDDSSSGDDDVQIAGKKKKRRKSLLMSMAKDCILS